MSRPPFAVAWNASLQIHSSSDQARKVADMIGGAVAKNINMEPPHGWVNTCAIRISYILNKSGVAVPSIKGKTVSGADGSNFFFRVSDVIDYLTQRWGKPDMVLNKSAAQESALVNQKGLILFEVSGWSNAAGHATLWNGNGCYDHCYFSDASATYTTKRASFWSLA